MSVWTRERSNLCSHGGSFPQLPVEESAVKCWPIECHLQSPWITDGPWPLRCPHTIPNPPGQARRRSGCWSASCSETERWARPAWWSATQRTATQPNMFPLRSTTSQVSRGQILILYLLLPLIFIDQCFSQTLLHLQWWWYNSKTAQMQCKWVCRLWSVWLNGCKWINLSNFSELLFKFACLQSSPLSSCPTAVMDEFVFPIYLCPISVDAHQLSSLMFPLGTVPLSKLSRLSQQASCPGKSA